MSLSCALLCQSFTTTPRGMTAQGHLRALLPTASGLLSRWSNVTGCLHADLPSNLPHLLFLVLAALCGCGVSVPWLGIEPRSSAVKAQGSNHWTVRRFPKPATFDCQITSRQHSELSWNKGIFWTSLERERCSRRLWVLCSCPHH